MLDLLHISKAATLRGACTWHGRCRVLAGGTDAENSLGKIPLLEASAGIGWAGTEGKFPRKVTYVTQNSIDTDKIRPIM